MSEHDREVKKAQQYINATRHWNQGAGMIVPERLARKLREMGITEGYTVAPRPLSSQGEG